MERQREEFFGAEAIQYANEHLRKMRVSPDHWEIEYVNERTGETWVMDYPESEDHGGGNPRLRKKSFAKNQI